VLPSEAEFTWLLEILPAIVIETSEEPQDCVFFDLDSDSPSETGIKQRETGQT
jgi:hypothetical protein